MKQPLIAAHYCILVVFCSWTILQAPFFVYENVFAQTDEPGIDSYIDSYIAPNDESTLSTTDEQSIIDIALPSPDSDTIYEGVGEDSEIVHVQQDEIISGSSDGIGSDTNANTDDDTNSNTGNSQTIILDAITNNLVNNIPVILLEPINTGSDTINTSIIQTTYETVSSGATIQEYTEKVTLLQKEQLTITIPENTSIQTSEGEEITIDDLILIPSTGEVMQDTHTVSDLLAQEDTSVIISSRGNVSLTQAQYLIPEFSSTVDTQPAPTELPPTENTPTPASDKEPLQDMFEFGIPGEHLIFSEPVTISYAVPYPDGALVELQVQHAGETLPGIQGLSTDNAVTCSTDGLSSTGGSLAEVIGGQVTFFTCGASTFTLIYTGGASAPNFVDNGTKNFTGTVFTGVDFPTGSILNDVDILIDFRPIDNESPTGPRGTTNCYPAEKSFLLIHPDGTTVALGNAGTYTTPTTNCPQAQILYDQSAASGIVGGAWNLTGQSRIPVGNLSTLNGKSPFGTWTLRMGDSTAQDGIILYGFQLILKNIQCGDGLIGTGEICDDGNTDNGDGCTSSCSLEAGWTCTGEPSVCTAIPAPSGLLVHYNGSMTGALFTDVSGNGNNGTRFNSVTTGNQNGETIMCFNGTNQYIERATNLVTAYPFTMSTWIKTDTITGLHGIMSLARSNATNRMRNIEHNASTPRVNGQNTTATYTNGTSSLTTSQWFLVTSVFSSNTKRDIYINGLYETTNTTSVTYSSNANNRLNIGRFADSSPTNYFSGCLDDVRFYGSTLTSGQIYTLYAQPAALSTSYTTSSSPQLTGTIQGALDKITLTISGNIYTGTNNGSGSRSLSGGIILPTLPSGTYPTILTVTNPYGRSVTYNSSFTVSIPVGTGTYCISGPTSMSFPQITTEGYMQTGYMSSSGYFQLIDTKGGNSGYYTTLQVTSLSGGSTAISNTGLARQSTGIVLLSGTTNTGVVLGSAFSSYSVSSGTVTFIKRDPATNSGKTGTYGAILQLRISLPAYIKPRVYTGTITYTLYEN